MYSKKLATYETHNARAGWDAESEIGSEMGDVEEVTTTANRVAVRTPVVQRGLGRPIPAISRNEIGGSGRGRDNESATRGRGRGTTTDVRGRGRGRGIDRGSSSNGSHRGGGVSRGNLRGNAGRGGHHSVPTGRGNGRLAESAPRGGHSRDGTGSSQIPSGDNRADLALPRRPVVRVREPGLNSATGWAEPTPLLTSALKSQLEYARDSRTNTKRFLKKPVDGEIFSAVGLYQWPNKGDSPEDLFREQLKDLDHLRTTWRVFIEWNSSRNWLIIRAPAPSGQTTIDEVIKGIRQAVASAHAREMMAAPLYIVVPPRYSTESTLLEASIDINKHVHGLKFSKQSSNEELKNQTPPRSLKVEATVEKFRAELNKNLNELSHLKDWMQMRVHFGELHLTHWQTALTDGKQNLDGFMKMMKRTRTRGVFEKGVNPRAVKYMMEKVKSKSNDFMVYSASDYVLADVQPRHVAIFIVQNSSGEMFQIEADIDKAFDGYQCGAVKVIEDERRNKCVEIVTIDIEKVDWTIEITSETAGTTIDPSFQDLVQSCIQPFVRVGLHTREVNERTDKYGFKYPRITPRGQPGLRVEKVTLSSIYRFKTSTGGYCLEFTINREWEGLKTIPEPKVSAGVTMFHDQWDSDMNSNENTTADRGWAKDMSNFFPNGGFEVFIRQLNYLLNGFHQSKLNSALAV